MININKFVVSIFYLNYNVCLIKYFYNIYYNIYNKYFIYNNIHNKCLWSIQDHKNVYEIFKVSLINICKYFTNIVCCLNILNFV